MMVHGYRGRFVTGPLYNGVGDHGSFYLLFVSRQSNVVLQDTPGRWFVAECLDCWRRFQVSCVVSAVIDRSGFCSIHWDHR